MTVFEKWFALHLWKCQIKFQNYRQAFGYWVKCTMGQDFNHITKFDWCSVIFFWKIEFFFLSHYEPNVKVSMCNKIWGFFSFKQTFTTAYERTGVSIVLCGSPLLKKTTTHLGQPRESTGEFSRSVQGTPKLTITKLRPAYYVRLHAQFCYQTNLYSLMVILL